MTKQNKYSGRNWFRLNRGSKSRRMAKSPLGKPNLPLHYELMVEKFDKNISEYRKDKMEQYAKKDEGVVLNIVYDDEKDMPPGSKEFSYNMDQKD